MLLENLACIYDLCIFVTIEHHKTRLSVYVHQDFNCYILERFNLTG